MPQRFMSDRQSLILMRFDEASGTPANIGYGTGAVTYSGTTVVSVADQHFEKARKFASSTDVVEIVNSTHYERMHMGCWCKCYDAVGGSLQHIIVLFGPYCSIYLNNSGEIIARVRCLDNVYYPTPAVDFTPYDNEWTYVFLNFDGYAVKLFINGDEVSENSSMPGNSVLDTSGGYDFYIGNYDPGVWQTPFDGEIAEVTMGAEPRWIHEIKAPYVLDTSDEPALGFQEEPGETIALYNFDDDVGGTVVDDTGTHDGTVTGTVTLVTNAAVGKKSAAKARRFPGSTGNYITVSHHTDFNISNTQGLSIEVLARLDAISINRVFASKWGSTERNGWEFRINSNNKVTGVIGDDDSSFAFECEGSDKGMTTGRVIYVAASFDFRHKIILLYGNGRSTEILRDTILGVDFAEIPNTNDLILGQRLDDIPNYPIDGDAFSYRFTNRPKTLKEFDAFYTGSNMRRWV